MPPKESDPLASPSVRRKMASPMERSFFSPTAHRKSSRCGHQYRVSARNCPGPGHHRLCRPGAVRHRPSDRRGSRSSRPEAAPSENGRCHRGIHPGDPRQLGRQSPLVFARTQPKKIQNPFTKHLYSQLIRAIISLPSQDRAPVLPKNA